VDHFTRREFLALAGGAAGVMTTPALGTLSRGREAGDTGTVILFQGDSITDCGRDRSSSSPNTFAELGSGYPLLAAAPVLKTHPERNLRFYNRGIGGNKVPDLQARWDRDTLALHPDILSLLVGVNDYWHRKTFGYKGTAADFASGLSSILGDARRALPAVKLVVLEPFVLRYGSVDASWFPEFDEHREIVAKVAASMEATFVSLQSTFDELARQAGPGYWVVDGVHPTPAGHEVIAERWRDAVL
jgi:lysophospholipase L1-like esterase